jgi:hypothetical protein
MNSTTHHDQLQTVSALAATLADRMLMERLTRGTLPLANASRLWTASLLLEEHQHPIPRIVVDVLDEVRHSEPEEETHDPIAEAGPDVTVPARRPGSAPPKGRLVRMLRPFRRSATA